MSQEPRNCLALVRQPHQVHSPRCGQATFSPCPCEPLQRAASGPGRGSHTVGHQRVRMQGWKPRLSNHRSDFPSLLKLHWTEGSCPPCLQEGRGVPCANMVESAYHMDEGPWSNIHWKGHLLLIFPLPRSSFFPEYIPLVFPKSFIILKSRRTWREHINHYL